MKTNFQFSIFNFQKRGFTLIETMVAIAILTLSIAGPLYTANRAIVAAETASSQLTATYLAQEGIEYVRMMRDNEYLLAYHAGTNISSIAWTNFLNNPISDLSAITQCIAPNKCILDPVQGVLAPLTQCPVSGGQGNCTAPLYLISKGIYSEQNVSGTGVLTPFTRSIQAVFVSPADERIVSTVSWSFHGMPYAVTVTDHLTPWQ